MKNTIILSFSLASLFLAIKLFASTLWAFEYLWIFILLSFFLLTIYLKPLQKSILISGLAIYLPFFLIHSLLVILQVTFQLNWFNNEYLYGINTVIPNVLLPAAIIYALYINAYGWRGAIISFITLLSHVLAFFSKSFEILVLSGGLTALLFFAKFPEEPKKWKLFLLIYFPLFFIKTLSWLYEPLFTHAAFNSERGSILFIDLIIPISIFMGLWWRNNNLKQRLGIFSSLFVVYTFLGFIAYPNYSTFIQKQRNFSLQKDYTIIDENGNQVQLGRIEGKLVVLNIWNSRCGYCFKAFPEWENLMEFYRSNENVVFYTVNIPYKSDNREQLLDKINSKYHFIVYFGDDTLLNDFKVESFPKLIILKDGKIKYHGKPEFDALDYYSAYKLIDGLLKYY